ncbi:hypothetical protein [Novosphingobium sp.]|jgi:hypothetical protein|uniref:hypothetical protein n=1 Tax=Novosphingobium sp. TaxID=1874826 RepID=UPI002FE3628E
MILRVSMKVRDPRHVAAVLAEIVDRPAVPAGAGWVIASTQGPDLAILERPEGAPSSSDSGISLATPLTIAEVFAIAGREGWPARHRRPPGTSGVIELLLEGDSRIDVLTAEMQGA